MKTKSNPLARCPFCSGPLHTTYIRVRSKGTRSWVPTEWKYCMTDTLMFATKKRHKKKVKK